MGIWNAEEAQKVTNGKLLGAPAWQVSSIAIDSRRVKKGDLFIALKGEKTDGHNFVSAALQNGASAIMAERMPENLPENAPILLVENCIRALYKLAEYRRAESKAKIIAVTGSVGKTSTKEMLNIVFSGFGKTHVSAGNNNNEIGAPLSLAKMPADTEFAIFELGMNHANEISPLSKLVRPHITIITTVEAVHIENFANIEGIALAKSEIFHGAEKGATAILNLDNKFFNFLTSEAKKSGIKKIISFGENSKSDARLISHTSKKISAVICKEAVEFFLSARGKHMAVNSLAVLAATSAAGQNIKKAAASLAQFSAQEGRGLIMEMPFADGKITLIDESYNASPPAMRAALDNLGDIKTANHKIAVIGDMLELGNISEQMHKEVANDILRNNIDLVFTVGQRAKIILENLPEKLRGQSTENASQMLPILQNTLRSGDIVLVKASHGIGLGKIIEHLSKVKNNAV